MTRSLFWLYALCFFTHFALNSPLEALSDSSSTYATAVRADKPLLYLRFEEAEGNSILAAETPQGIASAQLIKPDGYVFQAYTSAYTALGKAICFRRDPRAYVQIASADALRLNLDFAPSSEFTIEAWINPYQVGPFSQTIVSLDPAYGSEGYIFSLESDGSLTFHRLASPGIQTAANVITNGTWHHVALVVKQVNKQSQAMIYVNGTQAVAQWVSIAAMAPGSNAPFLIGSRNIIAGDYSFVGCIDELAVYGKALPATTLLNHISLAVISLKPAIQMSHAQQVMLNRGLQTQAWVLHGANLDPNLWNGIHLSTPAIGPADLTSGVLATLGKNSWAYKAPLKTLAADTDLLNVSAQNLSNLVSIQYGDEQDVTTLSSQQQIYSYYQEVRKRFPNVLLHTNQTGLQLTESQLRTLVQTTQPDILTFDTYYFDTLPYPGGSLTGMYNRLAKYRKIANRGLDDTSTAPLPFGHFVQGFLSSGGKMSESQVRAQLFAAWTFGAKWISMFWYNFLDANGPSFLFGKWPDGNPLSGYTYYSKALGETNYLKRALVNLQSTDLYFIPGSYLSNNVTVTNPLPMPNVFPWNSQVHPYLKTVAVTNMGSLNNRLPGDVAIGFFRCYNQSVSEDRYFMVYNGLTDYNGNAQDTLQSLSLTFDFSGTNFKSLLRINRQSGAVETIKPQVQVGSKATFMIMLEGGTADLLKIDDGTGFVGF